MTLLGTHRADITPWRPVPLAGYASRAALGPAQQVLAPLHLRTMVFGEDGEMPVVLIGADLLWWGDELVASLRQQVQTRFGIPGEHLVLHATHTHSGPQTCQYMAPSLGQVDEQYLDQLRSTTLSSIEAALQGRRRVSMDVTRAPAEVSVNRRWARTAGRLPRTPIDDELTTVRFCDTDGEPVALLVHFACHPVIHHGHAFTSDFPGALTRELESDTAPLTMFLQGCCGDVNPARYAPDGTFNNAGQSAVDAMGHDLAKVVRTALADRPAGEHPRVRIRRSRVDLPLQERAGLDQLHTWSQGTGPRAEWAQVMLEHPDRFRRDPALELVRMDLGADLHLLGMPAEPFSLFGLHAKRVSGNTCLPLGYTDGMTTYLVGAHHHAEGGYESTEAPLYLGMPAPLVPTAEETILAAITDLVAAPQHAHRAGDTVTKT